jgi:mannosyl-oligosaccharide glucosidase
LGQHELPRGATALGTSLSHFLPFPLSICTYFFQNLGQQKGPYQARARKIYTSLRKNLVNTVYESWKETGFAWEQYNPETGKGQRTQHFTGWTSLVVKIMGMPDLEERGKDEL